MKNRGMKIFNSVSLIIPALFMIGVAVFISSGLKSLRKSDTTQAAACPGDVSNITSYGSLTFIKKCLRTNTTMYSGDQRYSYFRIDPTMEGGTVIETPNTEIKDDPNLRWSVTLTQPGTLYIATRHIFQSLAPGWVTTQYTRQTNDDLSNLNQYLLRKNDQGLIGVYDIYKRQVSAGTYQMEKAGDIPGNAYSMYVVIFVPNPDSSNTPTPTNSPVPTPPDTGGGNNGNTTDCSRYPEKRIFLETQAWWMDTASIKTPTQTSVKGIGGHTHTATCFPQDQDFNGSTLHLDLRLMIHKGNNSKIAKLDIGKGPSGTSLVQKSFNPPLQCTSDGTDLKAACTWWVPIDVPTSSLSGYEEIRIRFFSDFSNGQRLNASTGWQAWFHGHGKTYRTPPFLEARGWFTGTNYENAQFLSQIPYGPVSGSYTFNTNMKPGSGGIATGTHSVNVDALFAADNFGKVLKQGTGPFGGSVTWDTTQYTNGWHCLAIVTSSIDKGGGTDTGVLQIPVFVQNSNPGSFGPGKGGCAPGT